MYTDIAIPKGGPGNSQKELLWLCHANGTTHQAVGMPGSDDENPMTSLSALMFHSKVNTVSLTSIVFQPAWWFGQRGIIHGQYRLKGKRSKHRIQIGEQQSDAKGRDHIMSHTFYASLSTLTVDFHDDTVTSARA
jgi:hypothetical protein